MLFISLAVLGSLSCLNSASALAVAVKCFPYETTAQDYMEKIEHEEKRNQEKEARKTAHFLMPTVSVDELTALYGQPYLIENKGSMTLSWSPAYWTSRTHVSLENRNDEYCVKSTAISRSQAFTIKFNSRGEEISRTPIREISY